MNCAGRLSWDSERLARHPFSKQRIDDAVAVAFACDEIVAHQRRERRLHGGRTAETMTRAYVGRVEAAALLEHDGAQHGALRQRQPLPCCFEHRLLLGEETFERLMEVVECRAPAAAA